MGTGLNGVLGVYAVTPVGQAPGSNQGLAQILHNLEQGHLVMEINKSVSPVMPGIVQVKLTS